MCVVHSLNSIVFVPVLCGCVWYVCCYVRKKALLQCLCIFRGRGTRTMSVNLHICGIILLVRAVLNMFVRNMSPRGTMCLVCQDPVSCLFNCLLELWGM